MHVQNPKVIQSISNLEEWHQNTQNERYIYYIRHSLLGKKTCPEQPHRASGSFMKVLGKMTTCLKHPLLSGPKSGCLIPV